MTSIRIARWIIATSIVASVAISVQQGWILG